MTPFRWAAEALTAAHKEIDPFANRHRVRDAAELLTASLGNLSGDELDVIGFVVQRLELGRVAYGQLEAGLDRRDFKREAAEEAADLLVYLAARVIRDAAPITSESPLAGRELEAYYLGRRVERELLNPKRRIWRWIRF